MTDFYSKYNDETLKVTDSRGFQHEVICRYYPHLGSVFILSGEKIIGSIDKERIFAPDNDNDHLWEIYEENLLQWKESAIVDVVPFCVEYFDSNYKPVTTYSIESYFRRRN